MLKNKLVLATITGLLLAAGWPTYGLPIFLFFAFIPLLFAEKEIRLSDKKRKGLKSFLLAYLAFLVWNSITTWWIWYSSAFGMFFAILVNTLLMALVFLVFHHVARRLPQRLHLIFLPVIWIAFEKFHLNWDFSWPWLNLGNAFSNHTAWIQWYEYTGVFGGSLWVWIINILLFKIIEKYRENKDRKALSRGIAINVLLFAVPVIISMIILKTYKESSEKVNIVVVQPNVDPYTEKFDQDNVTTTNELVAIAAEKIGPETDFVIAPETTLAMLTPIDKFQFTREKFVLQSLARKYPDINVLTGADMYRLYLNSKERPSKTANKTRRGDWVDYYNAAVLINRDDSLQFYIKSKLVVGVENFPFKSVLEPLLGDIMLDLGGTVATKGIQEERDILISQNKKFKAAPIICYESVYGEYVTDYVKKDANFLAIITNDAWWNNTQGHKQHLSYARLRAIETRRSIARSANTGISAFIDQKGNVLKTLGYELKGSLQASISLNSEKTFYVKYGDYIARLCVLLAGLIFLYAIAIKRKPKASLPPVK
ncbi:apolipoprotein N-acyltransferase [Leptobacterium flavescens]|uniref:Apolipoprotein N-acyltransferase n=1 Tax=Leptobacterium flavescens TaxID=472055 RepID=A0A6P0UI76_9FLAO|nr:apolipoprotein N-acyltransferase [Leptobacterium flavescens]NER12160.1 apolipoprotein N-acyltransferase [Leptobacterium flavescens]